jgi:hypothetical protein
MAGARGTALHSMPPAHALRRNPTRPLPHARGRAPGGEEDARVEAVPAHGVDGHVVSRVRLQVLAAVRLPSCEDSRSLSPLTLNRPPLPTFLLCFLNAFSPPRRRLALAARARRARSHARARTRGHRAARSQRLRSATTVSKAPCLVALFRLFKSLKPSLLVRPRFCAASAGTGAGAAFVFDPVFPATTLAAAASQQLPRSLANPRRRHSASSA